MKVKDGGARASCLPRSQRITAGQHALDSWTTHTSDFHQNLLYCTFSPQRNPPFRLLSSVSMQNETTVTVIFASWFRRVKRRVPHSHCVSMHMSNEKSTRAPLWPTTSDPMWDLADPYDDKICGRAVWRIHKNTPKVKSWYEVTLAECSRLKRIPRELEAEGREQCIKNEKRGKKKKAERTRP